MNEEPELIPATRTVHGYLASPLSEHISEMPDGSLLIVGCPVARTGWQQYAVRDLPLDRAKELGIDTANPAAMIDLYRPPEEVFSPTFLASLNGRPVTDGHPPNFVTPATFSKYSQGHIQNPRKGPEPLDDGEWPIIADIIISGEQLIQKVLDKRARDVSLGYDFGIDRDGDKIIQCDMVANHNAVVPKGRAGDLVSIGDNAAGDPPPRAAPPEPEASLPPPGSGNGHAVANINEPQRHKEKRKVKNPLLHIWGRGLKAMAADADTTPEELAEAAMDIGKRAGKDEPFEIEETEQVKDRKRHGRDLDPEIEVTHTNDRRQRMHDAFDRMLDTMGDRKAGDEDLNELGSMLKEFFGQEAQEPEHQVEDDEEDIVEADPAELEEVVAADEPDPEEMGPDGEEDIIAEDDEEDMECAHCGAAMDEEACPECGCRDGKARDKKPAKDRATAHDGATAALNTLRPVIARLNPRDPRQKAAMDGFNTALGVLRGKSRVRDAAANYGGFTRAAHARTGKLPSRAQAGDAVGAAADANAKVQDIYDRLRAGKAGK